MYSWGIRWTLRLPGVRASLGFTDEHIKELKGDGKDLVELPMDSASAVRVGYRASSVMGRLVVVWLCVSAVVFFWRYSQVMAGRAGFADATAMWGTALAWAAGLTGLQLLIFLAFDRTRARLEALRTEAFMRFPGHRELDQAYRIVEHLRNANMHDDIHPMNVRHALVPDTVAVGQTETPPNT